VTDKLHHGRVTVKILAHALTDETGRTPCCGATMGELARLRPQDRWATAGSDYPEVTCKGQWRR
jgi:hypothetical protein